jgi:endo-1,4-beta-xylanase
MKTKLFILSLLLVLVVLGCGTSSTTEEVTDYITDLPPMKEQFANYFLIGNIVGSLNAETTGTGESARITNPRLLHHFNALTSENNMKPDNITSRRNAETGEITYNWSNADRFVNAAYNSGFKVIGHTLLWHQQIPRWMQQMATEDRETALAAMRQYITEVVSRYRGKIYSWDVLNEIFPDNAPRGSNWKNVMRRGTGGEGQAGNPWYMAIGSDFVYEGFLAARRADPNAILFYNDYNTDGSNRARLIYEMVKEVNERYLASRDKPAGEDPRRLLIEGIGMQEHHNTDTSPANVRATINRFRPLGVRLAVTELDVLGQSWGQFRVIGSGINKHPASTVTQQGLENQARLYAEFMKVYMDNADIIDRVSFWGITDNQSWRSAGLPLLFDHAGRAKLGYYSIIEALKSR